MKIMYRNHIIYILSLLLLVTSCRERNPELFMDITGVYFNNMTGSMTVNDSLDVTFVYEADDVIDVPVRVQLTGRTADYDRPLDIAVDSDNAEEGKDYLLPENAMLPAGASFTDYVVRLNRTEALKKAEKTICLQIFSNEHFDLPVTHVVQVGDTVSTLTYTISFSDMFTKAPAAWDDNLVGEFSQQKFELICRVLEIDPADFNDQGVITLAKLLYISAEMTAYVQEQVLRKAEGEPYDKDAFDMITGEPLNFGR